MKMPSHCSVFVLGSKFCHLWCVLKYCVLFSPELSANFLFSFFTIKILFIYIFISLFLAVLGLCCCVQAFSHWGEWGLLSGCGMWSSPCGGFSCCKAENSRGVGSIVVAHQLSCPVARGSSLGEQSNLCSLHWQVNSYHWITRETPLFFCFGKVFYFQRIITEDVLAH